MFLILWYFRYAVKYNEQLIITLEEDEFSCKQRLAYKLEQVHNIMQGDTQWTYQWRNKEHRTIVRASFTIIAIFNTPIKSCPVYYY